MENLSKLILDPPPNGHDINTRAYQFMEGVV